MRAPSPPRLHRAMSLTALALFGVGGVLWLDRPVLSTDTDAAAFLGGVAFPGAPLFEAMAAAMLRHAPFDVRLAAGRLMALTAWLTAAAMLARRVLPTMIVAGPPPFRTEVTPRLLRWIVVALVLASAPVVATFHLGGALVPLALLLAAEECDADRNFAASAAFAFAASMHSAPFAIAALAGGMLSLGRARSASAAFRALAPGVALALRALPLAHDWAPQAFLETLPPSALPHVGIDGVVVGLGVIGLALALWKGSIHHVRPATEALVVVVVLPLAYVHREAWLGLDAPTARAAIVIALARPMGVAAAASFTLAGRDALAAYRRLFLAIAWLAFVARAGTDLAWRAREAFAETDAARALVADLPPHALVIVDDGRLFARLIVARANGAIEPTTSILRAAHEDPARLAVELSRDDALRPVVRDLTLRGDVDARSLFEVAEARPVRTGAVGMLRGDTAMRLVPAGFFLRPIDEVRETVATARNPEVDDRALDAVLGALREGHDRTTSIEAHRLLCSEASLFAYSGRREVAARYCHLMAPDLATIRCSVCPNELRVSAQDR